MGYIDDNLMKGEQVIYRTKLHWAVFLGPTILGILLLIPAIILTGPYFVRSFQFLFHAYLFNTIRFFFKLILTFCFFEVIPIIWAIFAYISLKTSEFGVTNKRVLVKVGFIQRISLETLLAKIESIQVGQGILGRMLNYGTIIIKGTGGTNNPFHKIAYPFDFRRKVQEQIDSLQKS